MFGWAELVGVESGWAPPPPIINYLQPNPLAPLMPFTDHIDSEPDPDLVAALYLARFHDPYYGAIGLRGRDVTRRVSLRLNGPRFVPRHILSPKKVLLVSY